MFIRIIATSIALCSVSFIPLAMGETENISQGVRTPENIADERLNRADYRDIIASRTTRLAGHPTNNALRWDIAQDERVTGNLDKAEEYLKPLFDDPLYKDEAIYTQGLIRYLQGDYAQAETLFRKASKDLRSQVRLLYVYYQTGQYAKAKTLFDDTQRESLSENDRALLSLMNSYGSDQPYRPVWKAEQSVLPFISMNHLPVVSVRVNGQPVNVFIDTGADLFVLNAAMAKKLNLELQASFTGTYAGGKTAETHYSRLQSLDLGEVTLHDVPIDIAEFPDSWVFTDEKTGEKIEVNGILSTGVFHQFLTSLDYPQRQLVLMPRNKESQRKVAADGGTHVPFILEGTHFMIVKGAVNGKEDMTFFLDSGLDDPDAAILLQKEALNYAGVKLQDGDHAIPDNDQGGLGGGGFAVTRLPIDSISVGTLNQKGSTGLYGVLPEELYFTESGMILDGFISHQFLKHYKWTIDFDAMVMTFQ
ncbi:aspartyl protease family protein [Citrobacter amalonaticus]|uniref:aspartyl protease family protein n=1 Tax=Citrobacter amalonaticus TaxID=35703 RepID=UPI00215BEDAA|nr:aspartyl protease family protein [Citrobacter amalonaticus]MCR9027893.1 aspartyl protease family protein [Citrobacter amalonaticus]